MATVTFPRSHQSNCSPASGQLTADPKMILATQHYWFFLFILFILDIVLFVPPPAMYTCTKSKSTGSPLHCFCLTAGSLRPPRPHRRLQEDNRVTPLFVTSNFILHFSLTIPRSHDVLLSGESLLAFSFATNLFNKLVLVGALIAD